MACCVVVRGQARFRNTTQANQAAKAKNHASAHQSIPWMCDDACIVQKKRQTNQTLWLHSMKHPGSLLMLMKMIAMVMVMMMMNMMMMMMMMMNMMTSFRRAG